MPATNVLANLFVTLYNSESRRKAECIILPTSKLASEVLKTLEKEGYIGKYDRIPTNYKTANENKPDTLSDQLTLLRRIGFKDVDCFYKYGIFSVFGGTK